MITKTFRELQEIDVMVAELYKKNPKLKDSKFGYAYKRFSDKNYVPMVRDFNDELGMLRVKFAMEDPATKEVLIDRMNVRGFKYTRQGLTDLMAEERKLEADYNLKPIEVQSYFVNKESIPEGLEEGQLDMLRGLVIE